MNPDILERLLIDRASGELSPDVSALLDHCIEREPGFTAEARETEATLDLAKAALNPATAISLPEPDFEHRVLSSRTSAPPRSHPMLWALGMAACLAFGLLVGWLAPHNQNPQPSPNPAHRLPKPVMAAVKSPEPGFWSIERYRSVYSGSSPRGNPQVIWKSPVRSPEINR